MKRNKLILEIVLVFIVCLVGCSAQEKENLREAMDDIAVLGDRSETYLTRGPEKKAYNAAKQVLEKEVLDCPSTAVYPAYEDSFVQINSDGSYSVNAYVDAQNLMGAMVRIKYNMTIIFEDDGEAFMYSYVLE